MGLLEVPSCLFILYILLVGYFMMLSLAFNKQCPDVSDWFLLVKYDFGLCFHFI